MEMSKNSNIIFFQVLNRLVEFLRSVGGTGVAGGMSWGALWLVNYDSEARDAIWNAVKETSKVGGCVVSVIASFFTGGATSGVAAGVCTGLLSNLDFQKTLKTADALATLKTGTDFFQAEVVDPVANTAQWLAVHAPPLFAALAIFVSFIELAPAMIHELAVNMGWGKHKRWWMMARRERAAAELVEEAASRPEVSPRLRGSIYSDKAAEKFSDEGGLSDAETEAPDDDDRLIDDDESDTESDNEINIEALAAQAATLEGDADSLAGLLYPESQESKVDVA